MPYCNLNDILPAARAGHYAVGAFNIVDLATTNAVIAAAEAKNAPVIVQTSVKTVKLYGVEVTGAFIRAAAKQAKVPVVLHLDHCKEPEFIHRCIAAGWSSVMIDASALPYEENVATTTAIVEAAHAAGVSVEGELGAIVGVEDDIFVKEGDAQLPEPDQAVEFVERTGVDCFAPAIGTAHGVYKGEPKIAFDLLDTIVQRQSAPVAIHGGTGLSDEVFAKVIRLGGAKVNISTQLKHCFRDSLADYFGEHPQDYEPVRAIGHLAGQTQGMVEAFIDKFGATGRAG